MPFDVTPASAGRATPHDADVHTVGESRERIADRLERTVPDDLRRNRRWLVWRYKPGAKADDKPRKVPYYVGTGKPRTGRAGCARRPRAVGDI